MQPVTAELVKTLAAVLLGLLHVRTELKYSVRRVSYLRMA